MLQLDLLKAFLAVANEGSFSAAANQLHITQPAMSKRIASLEHQLKTQLFDRIGRAVQLTEAGQALYPRAQHLLLEVIDIKKQMTNRHAPISGALALGTSHHIGLHRLPNYLQRFAEQYPQVKLNLQFADSEKAYEQVLQGQLELAVVTLPEIQLPAIQHKILWQDNLQCVVAHHHPLAQFKSVTRKQLLQHEAILPTQDTVTRQIVNRYFKQQASALRIAVETNYLETNRMLTEIGLGWSVLPTTLLQPSLKVLEITGMQMERNLGCIYHTNRTLSNAARAFLNILMEK